VTFTPPGAQSNLPPDASDPGRPAGRRPRRPPTSTPRQWRPAAYLGRTASTGWRGKGKLGKKKPRKGHG